MSDDDGGPSTPPRRTPPRSVPFFAASPSNLLAGHNLQVEESQEGLAALMIAYINGMLESDGELSQIVALWGFIDAPEKFRDYKKFLPDIQKVDPFLERKFLKEMLHFPYTLALLRNWR